MCGIVSIISKRQAGFFGGDLEHFEQLLILDTFRGLDSTGVFCVSTDRTVGFTKVASHPFHLFATQQYPQFRSQAINRGRILVGHNRKATQGSINSRNAHPFHAGNIVLVHNGTLRGDHKKDLAPVDVDSHALAIAFDEKGAENVIPTINGAFALVWWDVEKNRLFAVRNDERPLEIVETADNFYVVSESWMPLQVLARAGTKVINVHNVAPGKLHEFKIGGELKVSDIEVQTGYWSTTYTGNHTGRKQHGGAVASSVTPPKSLPASSSSTESSGQKHGTTQMTTSPSETKQQTSSNKPGPTLTLVKGQPSGEADKDHGSQPPDAIVNAAAHVHHPDFMKGQRVLVKFYEMKIHSGGAYYMCRGKAAEPGTDEIDVLAYIRLGAIPDGDQIKYLNKPVDVEVIKHTQSSCGRSLYVKDMKLPPIVDVHNNRITQTEWNHVTTYCKCNTCQATIYDEDREFTAVNRRPNNVYSAICASCIEESLKGQAKYEFSQNRLASIQAHIGVSESLAGSTESGAQAAPAGSQTLH